MTDFEVFDTKITSAQSRNIHNTQFKRNISLEEQKAQQEDRFLRGRQIAYMICEYFWVTGANDSVENYADLFTIVFRIDDFQEFDSKGNGILSSIMNITSEDILEGLCKLRKRESEKLKTVLARFIRRKLDLIITDWSQWWKEVSSRIYELIILKSETEIMRETSWSKIRGKTAWTKNQGDCLQWKGNGQCSKGENCSFRHDINKRAKTTQSNPSPSSSTRQNERNASRSRSPRDKSPSGRSFRWPCKDYSKELIVIPFVKNDILQNASSTSRRMDADLEKKKWSHTHRLAEEQASKMSNKNGDKSAGDHAEKNTTIGLRIQDMESSKFHRFCGRAQTYGNQSDVLNSQKSWQRHADIRNQNLSLGKICQNDPHQRNPNASKSEDRSQEETEWQERCVREATWRLTKSILKLKEKDEAVFLSSAENWCLSASWILKPEEREFFVDLRASIEFCRNGYFDEVV